MKRVLSITLLFAITSALLSGCWDSDEEKKAKEKEQHSKEFWDMGGPTDRSKDKGFKP